MMRSAFLKTGGPSFICFICQSQSRLSGPEGKQPGPLLTAWRSHAYGIGDGPQPEHWLSLTTLTLSPSLSLIPFCQLFISLYANALIANRFVLTLRLSCMCTLMDPSECRPFSTLPGNSQHLVGQRYHRVGSLLFSCLNKETSVSFCKLATTSLVDVQLLLLRPLYWNCGNQPSVMSHWVLIPKWQLSHFTENTPRTTQWLWRFSYQIQSDHYIYSSSSAVERMFLRNPERKANKLDEIWDLWGNRTTIKCFLSPKEVNSCFKHNVLLNSFIFFYMLRPGDEVFVCQQTRWRRWRRLLLSTSLAALPNSWASLLSTCTWLRKLLKLYSHSSRGCYFCCTCDTQSRQSCVTPLICTSRVKVQSSMSGLHVLQVLCSYTLIMH